MKKRPAKPRSGNNARPKIRRVGLFAGLVGATLVAIGAGLWLRQAEPESGRLPPRGQTTSLERRHLVGPLTFNRDIAPIIHVHCASCHRPGESAPFELLTYHDVRGRAKDIVDTTSRRYMPPWLPSADGPALVGERRLSDEEVAAIRRWVAEGAIEGAASDRPPTPQWPEGWQLGTPDLVVSMPKAYELAAGGRDVYRNFVIPLPLSERRFVSAVEFKADTRVVHHAFVRFDRSGQSRRLDGQDAEVGFGGIALPPSVESPGGHFLSWQPGRGPTEFPEGLSWALEPGRDLIIQAHLQPSGKAERVQSRVGFYFTDRAPTNTPYKIGLSSFAIDIPAGTRDYVVRDERVLPVDVDVLAVLPHAHYLARSFRGSVTLPSGVTQPLLTIPQWDFNWQSDYRFREPIFLPKGSRLEMQFTYDNTTNNLRNPHQPPVRVGFGLQSADEMAEMWVQVLPRRADDRRLLEADTANRMVRDVISFNTIAIQQNPTNAHARVQLAKALIATGKKEEAFDQLQQAVTINRNEEEGHYHIGILLMDSQPQAAESAFLETVRINPENFKAHNNLGLILMRAGRKAEAEVEFNTALKLNPGDAIVLDNLRLLRAGPR